jgi:hypothetical protein
LDAEYELMLRWEGQVRPPICPALRLDGGKADGRVRDHSN